MHALIILVALALSPSSPDHDALREQGRALSAAFYQHDLASLWRRFTPQMQQALGDLEGLRSFRAQVEAEAGAEEAVLSELAELSGGFRVYRRIARFSKAAAPVEVRWTLATDGKVAGFFVRPLPTDAESPYAGYRTRTELRLPFRGAWFVFWGGHTREQVGHHAATWDQRYAYDFLMRRLSGTHAGAGRRNEDYYCFDQPIFAPAAGTVVASENSVADNVPGEMNPRQALGNHVILAHGNGEFSFLCHFRQGTVLVRTGDRVESGQTLGRCGNSGNSSEPHLHYHLQDTAVFGHGLGFPASFSDYQADGKVVTRGVPLRGQTIQAR